LAVPPNFNKFPNCGGGGGGVWTVEHIQNKASFSYDLFFSEFFNSILQHCLNFGS
jgi:hypothetical protein